MTGCKRCNRRVRPARTSPDEYPDTVLTHARGLCKVCWLAVEAEGRLDAEYPMLGYLKPPKEPTRCEGVCGRQLRPHRTDLAEFPGTIALYGERRCKACWTAMGHVGENYGQKQSVISNRRTLELWLARRRPSKRVKVVRL